MLCSGLKGHGEVENADARRGQGSFPFSKGESENQKGLASRLDFATLRGLPSVISLSLRWYSSRKLAERSVSGLAARWNHPGICPKYCCLAQPWTIQAESWRAELSSVLKLSQTTLMGGQSKATGPEVLQDACLGLPVWVTYNPSNLTGLLKHMVMSQPQVDRSAMTLLASPSSAGLG